MDIRKIDEQDLTSTRDAIEFPCITGDDRRQTSPTARPIARPIAAARYPQKQFLVKLRVLPKVKICFRMLRV